MHADWSDGSAQGRITDSRDMLARHSIVLQISESTSSLQDAPALTRIRPQDEAVITGGCGQELARQSTRFTLGKSIKARSSKGGRVKREASAAK